MAQSGVQPMSTEPEHQEDEQGALPIRHVQTVEVSERTDSDGYRATVTEAVRAAGLEEGASFQFQPYEIEELGLIPALGAAPDEDAPKDRHTRIATGDGGTSMRLAMPAEVVETLEQHTEREHEPDDDEFRLLVDVFAGERMIAFAPAEAIEIPIEALPEDPDRVVDDSHDVLRLEPIQTARPRVKVTDGEGQSRVTQMTATTAIRAAGLKSTVDKPHSVSYHPEAAEALGGLIPAVGYQREAGRADPEYSIYREHGRTDDPASEGYSIALPNEMLDALDLTRDELEKLGPRDRPEITVYAGEGVLGFKLPAIREIPADRSRVYDLTAIDGIGEAVADRLQDLGYNSPEELADVSRETLLGVDGVTPTRAERAIADLQDREDAA